VKPSAERINCVRERYLYKTSAGLESRCIVRVTGIDVVACLIRWREVDRFLIVWQQILPGVLHIQYPVSDWHRLPGLLLSWCILTALVFDIIGPLLETADCRSLVEIVVASGGPSKSLATGVVDAAVGGPLVCVSNPDITTDCFHDSPIEV